jgi:Fe-S-cluster containining protein
MSIKVKTPLNGYEDVYVNGKYRGRRLTATYDICINQCGGKCCRAPMTLRMSKEAAFKFRQTAKAHGKKVVMFSVPYTQDFAMTMAEQEGRHCPFLDTETNLCGIYEDRPTACRRFPTQPQEICMLWPKT